MQCPNCHSTVPDTANVCGYCGVRLRASASQPMPASSRRKIPTWVWIILVFLCIGMMIVTAWAVFLSDITINLGTAPNWMSAWI